LPLPLLVLSWKPCFAVCVYCLAVTLVILRLFRLRQCSGLGLFYLTDRIKTYTKDNQAFLLNAYPSCYSWFRLDSRPIWYYTIGRLRLIDSRCIFSQRSPHNCIYCVDRLTTQNLCLQPKISISVCRFPCLSILTETNELFSRMWSYSFIGSRP